MKPTPLYKFLQLGYIFLCTSCGDNNRLDTHQNESAIHTSDQASKTAHSSNKTSLPTTPNSIQDSTNEATKKVSSSRAKGDVITALSEMHKLMKQWSPIGLPKNEVIESLGKPTSSGDKSITYRFDHGEGGWQWVFDIENGLVSKVHKVGLE